MIFQTKGVNKVKKIPKKHINIHDGSLFLAWYRFFNETIKISFMGINRISKSTNICNKAKIIIIIIIKT
jgi:hypothetical protein